MALFGNAHVIAGRVQGHCLARAVPGAESTEVNYPLIGGTADDEVAPYSAAYLKRFGRPRILTPEDQSAAKPPERHGPVATRSVVRRNPYHVATGHGLPSSTQAEIRGEVLAIRGSQLAAAAAEVGIDLARFRIHHDRLEYELPARR
jgi:hypothetical protein